MCEVVCCVCHVCGVLALEWSLKSSCVHVCMCVCVCVCVHVYVLVMVELCVREVHGLENRISQRER